MSFKPEEITKLKADIESRFPDWVYAGQGAGYGETYLVAERRFPVRGSVERQQAMSPEALLDALEWRERHLRSVETTTTVQVHEGLANSDNF